MILITRTTQMWKMRKITQVYKFWTSVSFESVNVAICYTASCSVSSVWRIYVYSWVYISWPKVLMIKAKLSVWWGFTHFHWLWSFLWWIHCGYTVEQISFLYHNQIIYIYIYIFCRTICLLIGLHLQLNMDYRPSLLFFQWSTYKPIIRWRRLSDGRVLCHTQYPWWEPLKE